jgi:mannose-6-phosphate isomerase-like protein (cupin superfamily)
MTSLSSKSFDEPDEQRTPDKTTVDVVRLSGATVARVTFEPGWKWSECVKPVAGTDSCMVHHNGFVASGSLHIVMDDGTEYDVNAGDVFVCPPGHDAWVTSDEPCIAYDFSPAAANYAKPAD